MVAAPAQAGTGCNGVVNLFVWGCAPWDNNNGSQFPYYRKKQVDIRVPAGARVHVKDGSAVVEFNGQKYPVVGGAGVVAAGSANVVSAGGANVVSAGGANMKVWVQN
jgi:hypothetical protein